MQGVRTDTKATNRHAIIHELPIDYGDAEPLGWCSELVTAPDATDAAPW
jgi:hypothetical protein